MDTHSVKLERMIIRSSHIPYGKREELRENIEQNGGLAYLLAGKIDAGELIALIPNPASRKWLLISDTERYELPLENKKSISYGEIRHTEIALPNEAFQNLLEILCQSSCMKLVHDENKSGRPPKYALGDAKRVFELRQHGTSIRAIAKQEKMSPSTVQKLEKEWQLHLLSVGGEQEPKQ